MEFSAGQLIYVAVPYVNENNVLLYQIQETAMTYARPFSGGPDDIANGYNIRFKYTDVEQNKRKRYNCTVYAEKDAPYTDDFDLKRHQWGNKSIYGLLFFDEDKDRLMSFVKKLLKDEIEQARSIIFEINEKLNALEEGIKCEKNLEQL